MSIWRLLKSPIERNNKVLDAAKKVIHDHQKHAQDYRPDHAQSGFDQIAQIEHQRIAPLEFDMDGLTHMEAAVAEETYKPFIMLKAAQHILSHLDASPPRKYSFKEWTWLLKLLGEDETDEQGHRRVGQALPEGAEVVTPVRTKQHHVWSWLGQESPLMSLEEGMLAPFSCFRLLCCGLVLMWLW